jgi:hypothetical protein
MNRKTNSLAYPSNPLAAMRDLQELDAVAHATGSAESSVVAQQPSSERGSVDSSADSGAETLADSQKPTPKRSSRTRSSATESDEETSNPMADAVWQMLQQPYTADARKGPFTVSTVKIPTEVWERLGWVATLTGQHKQEIITEALKTHFEKVLKTRR